MTDVTERIAAVASKVGIIAGVGAAGASWIENIPPGIVIGLITGLSGIAVQVFFRWLSDRRERKRADFEEKLRLIEHEAFLRRYAYNTQGMPLEPLKGTYDDI